MVVAAAGGDARAEGDHHKRAGDDGTGAGFMVHDFTLGSFVKRGALGDSYE
ncbi:hypothetical protein GCM10022232_35320 [Streptomyces plumbiresistens]|uniref:Uncharacterized protein n=1 Tax=Streptomyces plumbiresistens TaxID=511811 RepID=A0ABP7RD42_9ACTN